MKISSKMAKALNDEIAWETYASNYYLSAASWCEVTGYEGAAKFFYKQSDEERQHMLKFVHYLNGVGIPAQIPQVKQPPKNLKSLEALCKTGLENERTVTKAIHKMVDLAHKEKDHSTQSFLQWFITEQIEEENTFETILQKFALLGRDKLAVYEIDKILGSMSESKTE